MKTNPVLESNHLPNLNFPELSKFFHFGLFVLGMMHNARPADNQSGMCIMSINCWSSNRRCYRVRFSGARRARRDAHVPLGDHIYADRHRIC